MPQQMYLITGQNGIIVVPVVPVRVNFDGFGGALPSPYNANPWDFITIDSSRGSVVIDLPTLSGAQTVWTKHDSNTSLASNTVTINGPGGTNIAQPSPNQGSFASSYQYPPAGTPAPNLELYRGTQLNWFNGGSAGGLLLTTH